MGAASTQLLWECGNGHVFAHDPACGEQAPGVPMYCQADHDEGEYEGEPCMDSSHLAPVNQAARQAELAAWGQPIAAAIRPQHEQLRTTLKNLGDRLGTTERPGSLIEARKAIGQLREVLDELDGALAQRQEKVSA